MAMPPKKRQAPVSLVPYSDSDEEEEEEEPPSLKPRKRATPAEVKEEEAVEAGATSPVRAVEGAPTTEEEREYWVIYSDSDVADEEERGMEAEGGAASVAAWEPSPEFSARSIPPASPFSSSSLPSLPGLDYPGLIQDPDSYLSFHRSFLDPDQKRARAGSMNPPLIGGTYLPLDPGIAAGGSINVAAKENVVEIIPQGVPLVGDKENISALAANWKTEDHITREKIKMLIANYAAFRRVRGDGNCFYRSFIFSYLEHIVERQDIAEILSICSRVRECIKRWNSAGQTKVHAKDSFYDFFWELINTALLREGMICSHVELLRNCRDLTISDALVLFFRFVISSEMRTREEFFRPFIDLRPDETMDQFYASAVEQMGQECDHVQIIALTDALRLPIRVVYLDRSLDLDGSPTLNYHDFCHPVDTPQGGSSSMHPSGSSWNPWLNPPEKGTSEPPRASDDGSSTLASRPAEIGATATNDPRRSNIPPAPSVTLLYRPGHYDILYPR